MKPQETQRNSPEFCDIIDGADSDLDGFGEEEEVDEIDDLYSDGLYGDNSYDYNLNGDDDELEDPLGVEQQTKSVYTLKSDIKWERKPFVTKMIPFERAAVHKNETQVNQKSPLEYFKTYFNDELFENFAFYTNLYAEQQEKVAFKATNAAEIRSLFGLHMIMGYIKLPRVRMYWSPVINLQMFKNQMTCDRFFQLRNNLHIVDNNTRPNDCSDKYFKVRPLLNTIRHRLLQFEVGENVSIDEQIIPFNGRLITKTYVKDKPTPWGLKNFVLCGKDGMPYDFFMYQGSTTEVSASNWAKFGFCASVVLHFSDRLTDRGHKLYFDNYFSSYPALEILRDKGINAGGTIRLDRFAHPPLLKENEMKKKGRGFSDSVVSHDGKVVIVKWQDNKSVHLASNFVGIGQTDTAKRWDKKQKKHVDVTRPEIVALYNGGMGGVDLLDQLISYYRVFIKSRKWPLRVIFHFMDFAVCASWIEYRKDCLAADVPKNRIMDLLKFRMELADCLLKTGNTVRTTKRGPPRSKSQNPSPPPRKLTNSNEVRPYKDVRFDGVDHLPEHDQNAWPTRCKNTNCSGRTFFQCIKCKVHLCITKDRNCFSDFHKTH